MYFALVDISVKILASLIIIDKYYNNVVLNLYKILQLQILEPRKCIRINVSTLSTSLKFTIETKNLYLNSFLFLFAVCVYGFKRKIWIQINELTFLDSDPDPMSI